MRRHVALAAALGAVAVTAGLTGDLGIMITGAAAAMALALGRGVWLRHLLAMTWAVAAIERLADTPKDAVVFTAIVSDLVIACAALTRLTYDSSRMDARLIGCISLALMPAHWAMSASQGAGPWWVWPLYAAGINAGFVLQCLIVGGWLDHVGRGIGGFLGRINPVRVLRRRGL